MQRRIILLPGAYCLLPGIGYNTRAHMNDDTNYLSKEKFDELTSELEHMKTVRRREIAEQLEYARSLGDLSENAEYEEARFPMHASSSTRRGIPCLWAVL